MKTDTFHVSKLARYIIDKTMAKKHWSLPKIVFLDVETHIHFLLATCNVCPLAIPELFAHNWHGYPITGKSFIKECFVILLSPWQSKVSQTFSKKAANKQEQVVKNLDWHVITIPLSGASFSLSRHCSKWSKTYLKHIPEKCRLW